MGSGVPALVISRRSPIRDQANTGQPRMKHVALPVAALKKCVRVHLSSCETSKFVLSKILYRDFEPGGLTKPTR